MGQNGIEVKTDVTPRPWSDFAESGEWWIESCDADGNPTGQVVCDAEAMSAADMLFIVRAVNAHDDLVEACAALVRMYGHLEDTSDDAWNVFDAARAALDKAKGNDGA